MNGWNNVVGRREMSVYDTNPWEKEEAEEKVKKDDVR